MVNEDHLRARADEGYIKFLFIHECVCALRKAPAWLLLLLRKDLARQEDNAGCLRGFYGNLERSRHLFGVARTHVEQVRHGSVERSKRNRLICRSILSHSDAVIHRKEDLQQALQRTHTDGECCA